MEVIWVEGRVRGELAPFVLFSPATCLFWVFPSQFPNKGKNALIQKRDQRWNKWSHFHTSCVATSEVDLMGEVRVVVFSFGWMDLGAKKKIRNFGLKIWMKRETMNQLGLQRTSQFPPKTAHGLPIVLPTGIGFCLKISPPAFLGFSPAVLIYLANFLSEYPNSLVEG